MKDVPRIGRNSVDALPTFQEMTGRGRHGLCQALRLRPIGLRVSSRGRHVGSDGHESLPDSARSTDGSFAERKATDPPGLANQGENRSGGRKVVAVSNCGDSIQAENTSVPPFFLARRCSVLRRASTEWPPPSARREQLGFKKGGRDGATSMDFESSRRNRRGRTNPASVRGGARGDSTGKLVRSSVRPLRGGGDFASRREAPEHPIVPQVLFMSTDTTLGVSGIERVPTLSR